MRQSSGAVITATEIPANQSLNAVSITENRLPRYRFAGNSHDLSLSLSLNLSQPPSSIPPSIQSNKRKLFTLNYHLLPCIEAPGKYIYISLSAIQKTNLLKCENSA